ncbi:MAG: type II toxin-antitoxin system HipA family toxin [Halobacteriovoraceae bacterium]|jgi:serine/threonine-protein kinase HipA|nr:type II toxin-antitoxin system HipA family toxin [Halobacteriovoraceae bacterium]
MSRSGKVYLHNNFVGTIGESNDGDYIFEYTDEYIASSNSEGVSLTLPKSVKIYRQAYLHGFFDGLIPEGWLLGHAVKNWKLKNNDRMGLLLNMCQSTIGATHIVGEGQDKISKFKNLVEYAGQTSLIKTKYTTDKCLISYESLVDPKDKKNESIKAELFRPIEAKRIFGDGKYQSQLDLGMDDLETMAKEQTNARINVTGVQKKLSLEIAKGEGASSGRLTIVDFDGSFILKPPSDDYPNMPEIEHLCMRMAKLAGFEVPGCALIPLRSGELAFIIKRFDRKGSTKHYQEDFCQLMDKPTADKYKSSIEKCSKIIKSHCEDKVTNLSLFFDLNFYNFLIGNADMHLKNFSLILNKKTMKYQLSPCYDLLSTKILLPEDIEQTALAINGKKNKLKKDDWISLALNMGLKESYVDVTIKRYKKFFPKMFSLIEKSFLTDENKELLKNLMRENLDQVS